MKCLNCGFDNPEKMNFCGICGQRLSLRTLSADLVQPLSGTRRIATVIMADVFSSTDLLERIGTEKWVEVMNAVLQLLGAAIYRHGGKVDQFRGDGLIAFFGTTTISADDAERAVSAALAMQESFAQFARSLFQQDHIDIQLRIGVNTGELIITQIGSEQIHREDTAMGGAVALAARLETQAEPGTIWVSHSTYELLTTRFEWVRVGKVSLRGFSNPVEVFRPIAARYEDDAMGPLFSSRQADQHLLGRHDEYHRLHYHTIGMLNQKTGAIVRLTGQRGMGKSFLLRILRRDVESYHRRKEGGHLSDLRRSSVKKVAWLRGRARSFDASRPFGLWFDLIRRYFGVRDGEDGIAIKQRITQQITQEWGGESQMVADWLSAFLAVENGNQSLQAAESRQNVNWTRDMGWFMRSDIHARTVVDRPSGELSRQNVFFMVRRLLRAFARRQPLIIIFDEVQWADQTSRELIKYCLSLISTEPILFILVEQQEPASSIAVFWRWIETHFEKAHACIELPPLTQTESHKLIDHYLGPYTLSDDMQTLLVRTSEGNPYFLEELLTELLNQGVLAHDPLSGRWITSRETTRVDLPSSLQTLLLSRVTRLSLAAQMTATWAAVIGHTFWDSLLKSLVGALGQPDSDLAQTLVQIEQFQIASPIGSSPTLGTEYRFHSDLIRESIYNSILRNDRRRYHEHFATIIAALPRNSLNNQEGTIAFHFEMAENKRRELQHRLTAAEMAQEAYGQAESLLHLNRAIVLLNDLLPSEQQDLELRQIAFRAYSQRRQIWYRQGQLDHSRRDAYILLDIANQLDEQPGYFIDALLQQPGVSFWQSEAEFQSGRRLTQKALTLAMDIGDLPREMHTLLAIARQARFEGDVTATTFAERALDLARILGDQRAEAFIHMWLSTTYTWSDNRSAAATHLDAAVDLSTELQDPSLRLELLKLFSLRTERAGDYHRLYHIYLNQRKKLAQKTEDRLAEAQALILQGQVQAIYLGDLTAGLAKLVSGRQLWQGSLIETLALIFIAHVLTLKGELKKARQALDHAEDQTGLMIEDPVRVAWHLVNAIWHNAHQSVSHWYTALGYTSLAHQLATERPLLSNQFVMAAATQATIAHLGLADSQVNERDYHLERALHESAVAARIYRSHRYSQVSECVSEAILYWRGRALESNNRAAEALLLYRYAHREMMRKHDMIPSGSHFRQSYLNQLPIHRQIAAKWQAYLERPQQTGVPPFATDGSIPGHNLDPG